MNIHELAKSIVYRNKKDWDLWVAVTGEERTGKSTFTTLLCQEICKVAHLKFSFKDNIIYSPNVKEIQDKITRLPKLAPINLDEAVKTFFNQEWWNDIAIYLSKFSALCGSENKCVILCMPKFAHFIKTLRTHRIKFWVHVVERGLAVGFFPDPSAFEDDQWHLDECKRLIRTSFKRKKFIDLSTNDLVRKYESLPIHACTIKFDDLTPEDKAIYASEKKAHQYLGMKKEEDELKHKPRTRERKHIHQLALLSLLLTKEHGYHYKELKDLLKVDLKSIRWWEELLTQDRVQGIPTSLITNKKFGNFINFLMEKGILIQNSPNVFNNKEDIANEDTNKQDPKPKRDT